jgi:four helix bundle protein
MIYVVTGSFCFFGSNTHAMRESGFRELHVWKRSRDLAVLIYRITENSSYKRDAGLRDQMRRASVSIASNIAEGDERSTNRESVRFFYIAKGSVAELMTQLELSKAVGYIKDDDFKRLLCKCEIIGRMLGKLIKVRGSHYP